MGGFQPRRRRPSLGNFRLRLDPEIEAELSAMALTAQSPTFRNLVLHPNWNELQESHLSFLRMRSASADRPGGGPVPRGAGPATPRAATVGDLMRAVWAVPTVQMAAGTVLNEVTRRFDRGWSRSSGGERALVVSSAVVIGGGAIAAIASNRESREFALGLIENQEIPVPGIDGLYVRLSPRGGGARVSDLGVPGLTASGGARANPAVRGGVEWDAQVTFDVAEYLRSR